MRLFVTRSVVLAGLLTGPLHASPANAQDGAKYLVAGPTFIKDAFQPFVLNATFGGEHREGPVGIGAEVNWIFVPPTDSTLGSSDAGTALGFSLYVAHHFKRFGSAHPVEPFVRGGLGVMTDFTHVGWWALEAAGGTDWRLGRRVALRTAVRGGITWIAYGFETSLVIR